MWYTLKKVVFGGSTFLALAGSTPPLLAAYHAAAIVLPSTAFASFDRWFYAVYQRMVMFFQLDLSRTQIFIYGDAPQPNESVVYMANHQCTVDWLVATLNASETDLLGRVQFILKASLRFTPIYGWYWRHHGFIYVNKSWQADGQRLQQNLQNLQHKRFPYWLVLFPEGTRFSAPRVVACKAFAGERGLKPLHNVLTPRTKGFLSCMDALRSTCGSVIDATIAYKRKGYGLRRPPAPSMFDMMTGAYNEIHIHLSRHPVSDLPHDHEALQAWLHERFAEKDRLLEGFYRVGAFPDAREFTARNTASGFLATVGILGFAALIYGTKYGRRALLAETVAAAACLAWVTYIY